MAQQTEAPAESPEWSELAGNWTKRVEFLKSEISKHLQMQILKQRWNKRVTVIMKIVIIAGGVLTTVLLGIKGYVPINYSDTMSAAALVISAAISGITAWEMFSEHAWRWIRARTMVAEIHDLKEDLEFSLTGRSPPDEKRLDEFYLRLKSILRSQNEVWASKRADAIGRSFGPSKTS